MKYTVSVDTQPPADAPELDALQRAGVIHLLRSGLESLAGILAGIEGEDGSEVELLDSFLAVHPAGALLKVVVDAPSLEAAEEAVRAITEELLEGSDLLSEWVVSKCEVELHPDLAEKSLDEDGEPGISSASVSGPAEDTTPSGLSEEEREALRVRICAMAPVLAAFSVASFGHFTESDEEDDEAPGEPLVSYEVAELAAGALAYSMEIFLDELFMDLAVLTEENSNAAQCDGPMMQLDSLPSQFALRYDERFARHLVVTAVTLTGRMTQSGFENLNCVAEELLLRLLLQTAEVTLELYGLMDQDVATAWEYFAEGVYEDMDHEWLYDPSMDGIEQDPAAAHLGIAPMGLKDWFTPFNKGRYVHPFAIYEDEEPSAANT
ncbi:hypothetical protein [Streptacidiphilus cavernicola]|uniref:Uncharacterized protein n=1 Tax=Streptacidiphilus cavernicola TaxID=3342716 RepID=A0ABV6VVM8_9ACTN